jgi:hypothetical protein
MPPFTSAPHRGTERTTREAKLSADRPGSAPDGIAALGANTGLVSRIRSGAEGGGPSTVSSPQAVSAAVTHRARTMPRPVSDGAT